MNYDKIILELLDRIKVLEEQVAALMDKKQKSSPSVKKASTGDIRAYIDERKMRAKNQNESILVLVAGDIHKEMQLTSSMPMVCNAMRQCMGVEDKVLYETASGYSSTLKIAYKI